MEIISLYIQQLKKDAQVEFLHTFIQRAEECPTIGANMAAWFGPLQTTFAEEQRIYHITLRSPLTEEIALCDGQRDGLVTGIKAITNSYLKSANADEVAAAKVLMVGLTSSRINNSDQYIAQTSQIDNLLNYMLVEQRAATMKLNLLIQAQELKAVNDRMHDLIEGRVSERLDKVTGAFEFARRQCEEAYRGFVKYLNTWALVFSEKLGGEARDLAEFIDWANALIEVYKQKVLHLPVDTPAAGDPSQDRDDPTEPLDPENPDGEPSGGEGDSGADSEGSGSNGGGSGSTGGSGSNGGSTGGSNPGSGSGTGIPIQPGPGGDDPDL